MIKITDRETFGNKLYSETIKAKSSEYYDGGVFIEITEYINADYIGGSSIQLPPDKAIKLAKSILKIVEVN